MSDFDERTRLLLGDEAVLCLGKKKIAVFGLGGVGSFVAEALVRCGIKNLVVIDNDKIALSNINRQLFALHSTVGKLKVDVAKERLCDINPDLQIETYSIFFNDETKNQIDFDSIDYIVDCIDSVNSKILLAKIANEKKIDIIACLGTGNKLNNNEFMVSDIYSTSVCPLAKVLRSRLKKEGIEALKVIYSVEEPIRKVENKVIPSISFVPSTAGMIIAGEVVKDLIK